MSRLHYDSTFNVVWDGMSVMRGHATSGEPGATGGSTTCFAALVVAGIMEGKTAYTNVAVDGSSWASITSSKAAQNALVSGKKNIVCAMATSNDIQAGLSISQVITNIQAYISYLNSGTIKPDAIVLLTSPPAAPGGLTAQQVINLNQSGAAVFDAMRARGRSWGARMIIDVRAGTIFDYPDYTNASFYNAVQNVGDGTTSGVWSDSRIHPGDKGHVAMAVPVGLGLARLTLR